MMWQRWIKDLHKLGDGWDVWDSRRNRGRALVAMAKRLSVPQIGQQVVDEDGYRGVVGIMYDDGDFVSWPGGNCASHPNPRVEK